MSEKIPTTFDANQQDLHIDKIYNGYNALLLAADKKLLPELAVALDGAGYNVISRGETAETIKRETEVPVIPVSSFLDGVGPSDSDIEMLTDEGQKEVVSGYLKQSLKLHSDRLERIGWPILDFAYVNLVEPEATDSPMGEYQYLKQDDNGKSVINGAIGGLRPVLMKPLQLPEAIKMLQYQPSLIQDSMYIAGTADQALRSQSVYKQNASVYLPFGHHTRPPAVPPS